MQISFRPYLIDIQITVSYLAPPTPLANEAGDQKRRSDGVCYRWNILISTTLKT